ncbi:MAG TPA: PadR family transcriptional regulator [Acidimicrobiales bacterium]|nr:PadR family transcriptional regulator [Acidimicrobiales bacterium]
MAAPPPPLRLTPVSYVVLGLIATNGPSTPYDLKAAVARSIGYVWSFPHTQLYAEPGRLASAGLLKERREEGGRRRRLFSLTPSGRRALDRWLRDPVEYSREIRDLGLLKLYFSGHAGDEALRHLAEAQEKGHRRRLEEFEAMATQIDRGDRHRVSVLRMGLLYERAAVRFWTEIAEGAVPDLDAP